MIALNAADYFEKAGFENYWQLTFLILGVIIIVCNIALMFVHEPQPTERQEAQRRTDENIQNKLGASNFATKLVAWIGGTIAGPILLPPLQALRSSRPSLWRTTLSEYDRSAAGEVCGTWDQHVALRA